ncbi:MAG: alpha-ketoacid dehydrogenase subunit beta [Thermoproteota archaeon]|nr:MAG: alpha-ketoacid dehydrogenase subunit beta [Candidatus Korarchaeota archaeon]
MPREIAMWEAINEAIRQEMERDSRIIVLGEDIGKMGGAFWCTQGLLEQFGSSRVIDTPISEAGFIGMAIGAALVGLRPIVELQFVDFFGVAWDQIYNHLAKLRYMSGGQFKLPVVIRAPVGGGYGDAAQHSQVLYSIFAHIPGLKVVAPSNPYDAKGLLISSIRCDDPVVFLEHKLLYGLFYLPPGSFGEVPEEPYELPLGEARIAAEGEDITIVGAAYTAYLAEKAADRLREQGVSAEVIDLRTLVPLDKHALRKSVEKTGRLLVVDEDYLPYGLTGEVIATIAEDAEAFKALKAPPARVGNPGVPVPFSEPLEKAVLPSEDKIVKEALKLVEA